MIDNKFLDLLIESEIYVRAFKTQSLPPRTVDNASELLKNIDKFKQDLESLRRLSKNRSHEPLLAKFVSECDIPTAAFKLTQDLGDK